MFFFIFKVFTQDAKLKVSVKKEEDVDSTTDQQAGGERSCSGTWGSPLSRSEKSAVKKTPVRKEKDIRKNTEDRRQKRGEHILLLHCMSISTDTQLLRFRAVKRTDIYPYYFILLSLITSLAVPMIVKLR